MAKGSGKGPSKVSSYTSTPRILGSLLGGSTTSYKAEGKGKKTGYGSTPKKASDSFRKKNK